MLRLTFCLSFLFYSGFILYKSYHIIFIVLVHVYCIEYVFGVNKSIEMSSNFCLSVNYYDWIL